MPAVHEDLAAVPGAVPLLESTGMRSVVTVPLKVEGRLTGSLGVAAESPGRYSNEEALRLQFAADRIALAVEIARLGELERLRRGSLSFLVEASDLLAGTLDRDQTLALMAQMAVPTLATWCAVYTIADQSSDPYLSYVLHEDEERIDGLKRPALQDQPAGAGADARRPRLDGPRRSRPPSGAARLDARPRPFRHLLHRWRPRQHPVDRRRGGRRNRCPAARRPQPRHRHAHPGQTLRRPLPPGNP